MQHYTGTRTDSSRWSKFGLRPGDVIVSTPPKCGTTWMMAVAAMLIHGTTELPAPLSAMSPWVDYGPTAMDDIIAVYGAQAGRRLIKTHTPLDGLPLNPDVRAISVLRNPIDALRSMRRHVSNMVAPPPDDPFLADEETVIARGLDLAFSPANVDEVCLDLLVRHLRAALEMRDAMPGAVMIAHYSDMKRDLAGVVAEVARFLGIGATDTFLEDVTGAASIASMRSKADIFAPLANKGHFSSNARFFAKGEDQGLRDLPGDLRTRYAERLAALLPPEEARWLDDGGPGLARPG